MRSDQVDGTKVSRSSVGGWSQARYQRHIEHYHLHHAKELVDALERVVREDGVEQIVLAGDEVIMPVLRDQLPKHLTDRIIDLLRLDITTPEHALLRATTEALREHDGETDAQHAENLVRQEAEIGTRFRNPAPQDGNASPNGGPTRSAKTAARKTRATPLQTPPGHKRGHNLVPGSTRPHARFPKAAPGAALRPSGRRRPPHPRRRGG